MTSQPGKQTIAIHILLIISRSEGNQTMKFGQLMEYNMRNMLHTKKIEIKHISGSMKVLYSLFLLYPKSRAIEIYCFIAICY